MAVSGRKEPDFQGSFSHGSAEDFEHCCAPCLIEGRHVEAHGYCLDCAEYLCKNCFGFHKKTKATRNHQLVDKGNMDKQWIPAKPVDVCIEKCSLHRNEVIKFFCQEHEELGCNDCMTMDHRSCKLDYIPDKCAGIGYSDEYREIVKELDQKLKEADGILKKAAGKDKEIDDSLDRVIKDIDRKRKDINNHLDTIQKKFETEANEEKARSKQEVKAVVTSCTNFISNVKKIKSNLQNGKAADQNVQLFIDIKRAKSELQSGEIQQAEMSLGKTRTKFTFSSNKDLENVLAVQSFGGLTELKAAADALSKHLQSLAIAPRRKGTFDSLQHKADIRLNKYREIAGCVALSSGKLVLADVYNNTLVVVNPEQKVVMEEKTLNTLPMDIAVIPQDQIAVTIPDEKQILVMTTAGKLSINCSIPVTGGYTSIIYHQNCLYVLWGNPCSIHVLDMKGNIKNIISPADHAVFSNPMSIMLSQDQSKVYVSNDENNSIVSVTLQGEVSAVYKHKDLAGPLGMLVLDDGSLLVCCTSNNSIYHISSDLKQGRTVMMGLNGPWSICFSADRSEVYIGCSGDKLEVCSVLYKM